VGAMGGDVMTSRVAHPWQLWNQKCQEGFLDIGKEIGDEGVLKIGWHHPTYYITIVSHVFNLE